MSMGGYDFGEIAGNVAKLTPREGDILVISGAVADEESANRIAREIDRRYRGKGVALMLVPEGDPVALLHPQNGDILLVRGDLDEETFDRLAEGLRASHPDLTICPVPDGAILEIADAEMMRTLGWVRASDQGASGS
jgi:Ni,Fe-hydrogenase III small subunit